MEPRVRRIALALFVLLAACQTHVEQSPAPSDRAALDMTVTRVPCLRAHATACFRVRITNIGPKTGGGSCVLYGETHRTSSPGLRS